MHVPFWRATVVLVETPGKAARVASGKMGVRAARETPLIKWALAEKEASAATVVTVVAVLAARVARQSLSFGMGPCRS